MSVWFYRDGNYGDFVIPVDCFKNNSEYKKGKLVPFTTNVYAQYKKFEIRHSDGTSLFFEMNEANTNLQFNLDEEGLIDSYELKDVS